MLKPSILFLKEPAQKKTVASTNGTLAKKAKDESSSEEESSDEVSLWLIYSSSWLFANIFDCFCLFFQEEVAAAKKPAAAKPAVKDSSSSEDDSEDESEDDKVRIFCFLFAYEKSVFTN